MKNEKLLNAIGNIDDELIVSAMHIPKKTKKSGWLKWGTLAASLMLLVCLSMYLGARLVPEEKPGEDLPDLPMLTISEVGGMGMGFEGYMAYNVSELVNANPWSEDAELTTLPVFQNSVSYDERWRASNADFEAMEDFLLEIAVRLGMDTEHLVIKDDVPDAEEQAAIREKFEGAGMELPEGYFNPTMLIAEEKGIKIEVEAAMTATITFEPAISLPDGYQFTYHASYQDTQAVAEYLKETYRELIGMEQPAINIHGGDYDIYLRQSYQIEFYEETKDLAEEIINYNFNRVTFDCDDNGELFIARVFQPDLSNRIGDYPIISAEEAQELLVKGSYRTSVPYEIPGREYIAGVELVYRTGAYETYYMPYYRFYVELPGEEREGGMKSYGAYYVPAVREEYLASGEDAPIWQ